MPRIVFVSHDGTVYPADAEVGTSVMQAAVDAMVPGILAECGGTASCGTCHGYVDEAWIARLPLPAANESEMLQCVLEPRANSRLTCQLKVSEQLDQLVIHLPKSQL